ncbi:DeoR/GlpR family DNA-binding transcription regulator [Boudabousia marimammalium]|uniref:Alkaline phosphatase n=1 Tax=Boudabousia marimammalium TaxID=156892 RepID=A0A1Q5PR44_9ACTO|nr:DeoR/GlpR family DNA-binding transcription regulator [Boudabousia marimammalium]OKL49905.1 alkaline phosphatase [Boudabousia marimammalium]
MNRSERLGHLINMVVEQGAVTIDEIVDQLEVSGATARRDLDMLAKQQLLIRTRGGARANSATGDLPLRYRTSRQSGEKIRLAKAAVDLIKPGSTISLNGGTTMTELAFELGIRSDQDERFQHDPVTVVTNAINIANDLTVRDNIRVVCTGGVARTRSYELVGTLASLILPRINIDLAFFGFDGLSARDGFFTHNAEEAAINQSMIVRAKQVVAVGDHTKLAQTAFAKICDFSKVDHLLIGAGAAPEIYETLQRNGMATTVILDNKE